MGGFQGSFDNAFAFGLQVFGELNNQDRILGRQTNHRDQADLEIHVVGVTAHPSSQQHANHAQRHDQNHCERNRPAFIQRGQAQENRQDGKAVQDQ